jgi:hypothetical protein
MFIDARLKRNTVERNHLEYQKDLMEEYPNHDPVENQAELDAINRRLEQNTLFRENLLRQIDSE